MDAAADEVEPVEVGEVVLAVEAGVVDDAAGVVVALAGVAVLEEAVAGGAVADDKEVPKT